MRTGSVLFFSLILAATASAQVLNVGTTYPANPNSGDINLGHPRTDIDLSNPAEGSGSIATVKVTWSSSACPNAFKIKFFRRTGSTLTMTAERGPFSSTSPTVTLTPPVDVRQGDLIGVSKLTDCGNPTAWTFNSDGYVAFKGDVTGTVKLGDGTRSNDALALNGTGTATEWVAGIIPVVGSAPGAFGAQFRTALQLLNHQIYQPKIIHARLIFHRAGTAGSMDDPSLAFTIGPGRIAPWSDVVAALGQTGLGSLDIAITAGDFWPLAVTRVYNDAGSAGTSGLSESYVTPMVGFQSHFLKRGSIGFLLTPQDTGRMRLNIGVRTWFSGADITATLIEGTGVPVRTVTKSYPPIWFEQTDAASFLGGPIAANQSIRFTINAGSAVIYGSTTDNTTNDPAIQLVFASYAEN
jgi:hypothetical protein